MSKAFRIVVVACLLSLPPAALAQQVGPNVEVGGGAEGDIAINPTDPDKLIVTSNGYENAFYSRDGGQEWQASNKLPKQLKIFADTNVAFDSEGDAYRQGLVPLPDGGAPLCTPGGSRRGVAIWKSTNDGRDYKDDKAYWAFDDPFGDADQGWVAIDTEPTSPYRDFIYVVWSDYGNPLNLTECPDGSPFPPGPTLDGPQVGFPLLFSRSTDGGETFSNPIDISDSSSFQEHSAHISTGPNGEIYVVYWRQFPGEIWFTKSLDGGSSWDRANCQDAGVPYCSAADVSPPEARLPNQRIAGIKPPYTGRTRAPDCSTEIPTLLSDDVRGNPTVFADPTDPSGETIYVSSMDYNNCPCPAEEPDCGLGGTDAWLARSTDGGSTWSEPVYISDGPRGPYRYYFQPRIAVAPNGVIDAVWYDTRNDATPNDTNDVTYDLYYSYSLDGGATFEPSVRVTDVSSEKVTNCGSQGICGHRVVYEYMGIASDAEGTIPLWTDLRTGSATQFMANISFGPDLVVADLSGPATAVAGTAIDVLDTVENRGAVDADAFVVDFYLSLDAEITASDIYLGSRSVDGGLVAGEGSSEITSLVIPSDLVGGDYTLGAIADGDDAVAEDDEDNNTLGVPIEITGLPHPDLLPTNVSGPAAADAGELITVSDSVSNQGAAAADPFVVNFYLSVDAVITTSDVFLGSRSVEAGLASGASSSADTELVVPMVAGGTYFLGAIADPDAAIAEEDEGNNALAGNTIVITALADPPDLEAKELRAPGKIDQGDTAKITDKVCNEGIGSAGPFSVGFYLSVDDEVTTSDTRIGERSVGGLAPGECSKTETFVPITAPVGNYKLGVIADELGEVAESDETNNVKTRGFQVKAP